MMKCAKGTQDFTPEQMVVRNKIYDIISKNYSRFGAKQIETPILEITEILQKKYGDGQKTLFDVDTSADSDSEALSLRYDLTVPLCRYCLQYGIVKDRFFQIGNSFRLDTPNLERGRRRQFVQADIDVVGEEKSLVLDVELINLGITTLMELGVPRENIVVKVNNRELLVATLLSKGVRDEQILTVCSSIDKLDKMEPSEVAKELADKGVDPIIIGKILDSDTPTLEQSEWSMLLLRYASALGIDEQIKIDLMLSRGMDYYTDIIYEFYIKDTPFGAVAAGGRYDNLTLQMGSTIKIPMIGLSLGVERIFKYLSATTLDKPELEGIYIARITKDGIDDIELSLYQLKVYSQIRRTESCRVVSSTAQKSISKQLQYALDNGYKFLITVGGREMESNTYTIKNLATKESETKYIIC